MAYKASISEFFAKEMRLAKSQVIGKRTIYKVR